MLNFVFSFLKLSMILVYPFILCLGIDLENNCMYLLLSCEIKKKMYFVTRVTQYRGSTLVSKGSSFHQQNQIFKVGDKILQDITF